MEQDTPPTPVPSPTTTEDERFLGMIPGAAKGDDLPAAIEVAKFFITLHPGLYQGEDPALFQFLSFPQCEFCIATLEVTRERVADGVVQLGGDSYAPDQVPKAVLDLETDDTTTALVGLYFVEEPHHTVDKNGVEIRRSEGGTYDISLALRLHEGIWRVYGVSVAPR